MSNTNNGASRWGIDNDYARLNDVLLGRPEYYRWVDAGPIIQRTLQNAEKTGANFDFQVAMAQHEEMVRIYEDAGGRLSLPCGRRGPAPQFLRPGLQRHDPLGGDHLPHAAEVPPR